MCRRITIFEYDDLVGIVRAIEYRSPLNTKPDWPVQRMDAFPNDLVPLLVSANAVDGVLEDEDRTWNEEALGGATTFSSMRFDPTRKRWGFESADRAQVIFNTRIETALERPLWKDSIEQRRCIVPVQAFYETHATEQAVNPRTGRTVKQSYRFTAHEDLLLLAGIWKSDRFSIVTTAPNESVSAVHDRMPLILSVDHAHEWLEGDWRSVPRTNDIALEARPLYMPQTTVEQPRLF